MELFYRINRLLMFAAMLVYVPLTLLLAAGLGWGGYRLTYWAVHVLSRIRGGIYSYGMILLLVVAVDLALGGVAMALLAGLVRLFTRFQGERPSGLLLTGGSHKHFFELLERVCRKLKARPPEECYLTPFSEMSVSDRIPAREEGRGRRKIRTLVIGAGLLVHIRVDEFTTILCHEIAHTKAGDTQLCWLTTRFYHALVAAIYAQFDTDEETVDPTSTWMNRVVATGLIAFYWLFSLMYAADERWCELRADRLAAEACGPQNMRNALIKIHLAGYVPGLSIEGLVGEYSQDESDMSNLYQEYRRRWAELSATAVQDAENAMFLHRHSLFDSHPCLTDRIRGLRGVEAKEVAGEKPATMLFANWEQLEASMTETLVKRGRYLHRAYMNRLLTEGRGQ